MRSTLIRAARRGAAAVAAVLLVVTAASVITPGASAAGVESAGSGSGTPPDRSVIVRRSGPDATIRFHRAAAGEVFLEVTVSARGVSWAAPGNESAVVSAYVDGHYATDIVIMSASPVTRRVRPRPPAGRRAHPGAALRRPPLTERRRRREAPGHRLLHRPAHQPRVRRREVRAGALRAQRRRSRWPIPEQPHGHPARRLAPGAARGEARTLGDRVLRRRGATRTAVRRRRP